MRVNSDNSGTLYANTDNPSWAHKSQTSETTQREEGVNNIQEFLIKNNLNFGPIAVS